MYRAGSEPRAALVVRDLFRVYPSSPEGRQVTVRYARPGDVLGVAVLVGGPANTSDQVTPAAVAQRYAELLRAPSKELVWFEHSAHLSHLEEPERFRQVLNRVRRGLPATA